MQDGISWMLNRFHITTNLPASHKSFFILPHTEMQLPLPPTGFFSSAVHPKDPFFLHIPDPCLSGSHHWNLHNAAPRLLAVLSQAQNVHCFLRLKWSKIKTTEFCFHLAAWSAFLPPPLPPTSAFLHSKDLLLRATLGYKTVKKTPPAPLKSSTVKVKVRQTWAKAAAPDDNFKGCWV